MSDLEHPPWSMHQVTAPEAGEGQKLHFQVRAVVPFIGMVTSYTGHLYIRNEAVEW